VRVGVSGHQRLPPLAVKAVRARVAQLLTEMGDVVGVSSLAAGADQLLAELILEHGGHLHAVIPCENYEATFSDIRDLQRFRALLGRAEQVEILDFEQPSEEAFMNAGRHVVEHSDLLIAVWDGKPAKGHGGTADIVDLAQRRGAKVEVIWPKGLIR
jgi:hypothetical protein